ncbi:hypothetical protein GCK72_000610 [Caenorhabditis remanei]|uniref:Uncharacterized protein n=1 Tax=Caenorhabditis remanei TaxID=31234 RepID=A0A6A5HR61_CAERE|nr:hypothetical protein GCK72_000610 [Caenorhabditis remanei]KAF1768797.1 hypothetical protein GCK72_000610 [Caenorhabditis remanei]
MNQCVRAFNNCFFSDTNTVNRIHGLQQGLGLPSVCTSARLIPRRCPYRRHSAAPPAAHFGMSLPQLLKSNHELRMPVVDVELLIGPVLRSLALLTSLHIILLAFFHSSSSHEYLLRIGKAVR